MHFSRGEWKSGNELQQEYSEFTEGGWGGGSNLNLLYIGIANRLEGEELEKLREENSSLREKKDRLEFRLKQLVHLIALTNLDIQKNSKLANNMKT